MSKSGKSKGESKNIIEKVAAFIVDRRKAFYLAYIVIAIFCLFSSGWVDVNNTLTDYLADDTETKQGLTIMDNEFTTYATADVMVDNISYEQAKYMSEKLLGIEGVKDIEFNDTDKHYTDGSALFSVTFSGNADDEISQTALDEIKSEFSGYDLYVSAELGNTKAETINAEIRVVMVITALIILLVLLFTSHTYMEIPVLVMTFGMAALMNKGTNYMFGTISFVSNSVAVVLQLALAIDYAIILCHRYMEEREYNAPREAVIAALSKAIPEISGSSLTTLSGLAAMTFMHFQIGYDMGIVLMKSILLSLLSVFTLMPGLLLSFSKWIDKTHHKNFVPKITIWGKFVVKWRSVVPFVFIPLIIVMFVLSNKCPYAYGYSNLSTITQNTAQIAQQTIENTFGKTNTLAMLVPTGDYEAERKLLNDLESFDEVDSVMGLSNIEATGGYTLTDKLMPRQFAELTDLDIEKARFVYSAYAASSDNYGKIVSGIDRYGVPLIDMFTFLYDQVQDGYVTLDKEMNDTLNDLNEQLSDAKKQLKGQNYSRLVMKLSAPEESKETFAFLTTLHNTAAKYYTGEVYLVGNSTSDYDLSTTFGNDNILISILSIIFVMIILLFTFQSSSIPIIQILVIQGSIWINFAFPFLQGKPLFFLSYLVTSSIQMGANIDYAIVITNRYTQLKQTMPPGEAMIETLNQAFPTILTSGSILAMAGIVIGLLSSDPAISSIGICLGRGTIISILLVMGVLPQLLILCDKIIEKTSFSLKHRALLKDYAGFMKVEGHIRGYINGRVDGDFSGIINGDVNASIENAVIDDKHTEDKNEKEIGYKQEAKQDETV